MTRLAIVVHRYGEEVGGGAEAYARAMALHLAADVDITVLTTCALDYRTWADHYPPGESEVGGVRVLRFSVPEPRERAEFDRLSVKAFAHPDDLALGKRWMAAQGPNPPGLLAHLREEGSSYDVVAFVTYLYATTAEGIGVVADRSILVPTMHDEPPLRLRLYDQVFAHARLLLFLTPEERELARARFGVSDERARIVGVGVDEPPAAEAARFRDATGVRRPYTLCLGRLDLSKGVGELLQHHALYRKARPEGLDLVLIGRGELDLPTHTWLHRTGFVDDQVKHAALAGAAVVVIPSPYESLSLAQLEAWSHGRPTLASAVSPVLVGQSRRAAGGLWYRGPEEYAVMLDLLATAPALADAIGRQGRRYVRETYTWERVRAAWLKAIDEVVQRTAVARRERRGLRCSRGRSAPPPPIRETTNMPPDREGIDNRNIELLLGWTLRKDSNCIDVGANEGRFLYHITQRAPEGRHFAWEPIPDLAERLRATFPNVEVRCAALYDEPGESDFVLVPEDTGYSGLRERAYPRDYETRTLRVPLERLDDALPDDYIPHFIKVDVEGAELQVLRGGLETIKRHRPVIAFEHGPGSAERYGTTPEAVHDLLCGQAGLRIFDLDARGPLTRQDISELFASGSRWNYVALP